jgi:hypothetical protein
MIVDLNVNLQRNVPCQQAGGFNDQTILFPLLITQWHLTPLALPNGTRNLFPTR